MKMIYKDILTITEGIICHQVNCEGVMESGLAKQIKENHPKVYTQYKKVCEDNGHSLLGNCLLVKIDDKLSIANLFGQLDNSHTDIEQLRNSLLSLKFMLGKDTKVYLPHNIGCDSDGRNWTQVLEVIKEVLPDAILCMNNKH